mmetsp:Transcript_6484/g.26239  ORF Transcript_6484/g.26239 Transcript_6484/m.26239 type:complete len:207 (+) Transcript_6484:467-1087(+)
MSWRKNVARECKRSRSLESVVRKNRVHIEKRSRSPRPRAFNRRFSGSVFQLLRSPGGDGLGDVQPPLDAAAPNALVNARGIFAHRRARARRLGGEPGGEPTDVGRQVVVRFHRRRRRSPHANLFRDRRARVILPARGRERRAEVEVEHASAAGRRRRARFLFVVFFGGGLRRLRIGIRIHRGRRKRRGGGVAPRHPLARVRPAGDQ